ncbi:hypothetical protein [Mycolicibacter senuensis]|uniref:hypothetical protein n=1 Tax=Mycolicibacter senuensis TaxID=386913 RepID=UPI0010582B88|nr:hypothetical protein [Mycolicibacter senuensis]
MSRSVDGSREQRRRAARLRAVTAAALTFGAATLSVGAPANADIPDFDDVLSDLAAPVVDVTSDADLPPLLDGLTFDPHLDLDSSLIHLSSETGPVVDVDSGPPAPPVVGAEEFAAAHDFGATYDSEAAHDAAGSAAATVPEGIHEQIEYYQAVLANYASQRVYLSPDERAFYDPYYENIAKSLQMMQCWELTGDMNSCVGVPGGDGFPGGNLPDINSPWADPLQLHNQVEDSVYRFLNDWFIAPLYTVGSWIYTVGSWIGWATDPLLPVAQFATEVAHNVAKGLADMVVSAARFLTGT